MYSFSVKVNGGFEKVIARVTDALKTQGFGVLTEIDVQATLKAKLDIDGQPYTILGACNPQLAHQALEVDPDIGLLLPCNVVVRKNQDESITVAFMDPAAVLALADKPEIAVLADEVRGRLLQVRESLALPAAA